MKETIADSPDEISVVLKTLEGEHLPTRKAYFGGAIAAPLIGVIGPVFLCWVLWHSDLTDPRAWRSIFTVIIGPFVGLGLLRGMAHYSVDDSHIAATGPLGIGSWTVMRAEIEKIEATTGTLLIHTAGRKHPLTMLLRKKKVRALMNEFPALRRMAGRAISAAAAEELARKRKNRLLFGFLGTLVVLVILVIVAIEYVRR